MGKNLVFVLGNYDMVSAILKLFFTWFFKDNASKLFLLTRLLLKTKINLSLQFPVKFGKIGLNANSDLPLATLLKKSLKQHQQEPNEKVSFGFCFFSEIRIPFFFQNEENKRPTKITKVE